MQVDESREKQKIFMALCMVSVVCAHTQVSAKLDIKMFYEVERFLGNVGCVGVAGFFIISGYTFFINKRKGIDFWKRKTVSLIIPWLFWSVAYGILSCIIQGERKSAISIITGWAGSYYIYTLIILYLLFKAFRNNYIRVCIGCISLGMTIAYSIRVFKWRVSPYFSLFPWTYWFVLGLFWEQLSKFLESWEKEKRYCLFIILTTCFSNILAMGNGINYFSICYIPYAIINLMFLHMISCKLFRLKFCRIYMCMIGDQTLWIMFTNFYVTVLFAKCLLYMRNGMALLLAPILTIILLVYLTSILKSMERKIRAMKQFNMVIGIR